MAVTYREFRPPPRLSETVECFWTLEPDGESVEHRIMPDGCIDVVLEDGRFLVAGAMNRYQDLPLRPGQRITGVRFRPGMAASFLPAPMQEIADRMVPLRELTRIPSGFGDRIEAAADPAGAVRQFEQMLAAGRQPDTVQRVCAHVALTHGQADLDWLAGQANLSTRQFRRLCLERAGVTPKRLCRIVRFRETARRLREDAVRSLADVALECGYYDQSHLTNEFREFSGRPPGRFLTSR
jgi:AraC-like DNA-binding protein